MKLKKLSGAFGLEKTEDEIIRGMGIEGCDVSVRDLVVQLANGT